MSRKISIYVILIKELKVFYKRILRNNKSWGLGIGKEAGGRGDTGTRGKTSEQKNRL
jgi:hypothetical protein